MTQQIWATITRLKLNDDELAEARQHWFDEHLKVKDKPRLQKYAPFIAYEAERQQIPWG